MEKNQSRSKTRFLLVNPKKATTTKKFGSYSKAIMSYRAFAPLYSVIPWHILCVLMTLIGKMTEFFIFPSTSAFRFPFILPSPLPPRSIMYAPSGSFHGKETMWKPANCIAIISEISNKRHRQTDAIVRQTPSIL